MSIEMVYDFVCLDVETTGLDQNKCEVVEVTAAEYNLDGFVGRVVSQLCRPVAGFIPPEASAINHITWDMVKDKPNYLSDGVREKMAEFLGNRTASGHNIISFDSGFLKIKLEKVVDTLQMCRSRFSGGNKLKTACIRLGIEWDDKAAHRSEYDVLQTIKLHCKLAALDAKTNNKREDLPLFSADDSVKEIISKETEFIKQFIDLDSIGDIKMGIKPSEKDKKLMSTQTYSYSRLNLFNQCPFKWFMQYIKGIKEPDKPYFQTGKICHKVAEWAGTWCYRKTFTNKLYRYLSNKKFVINEEITSKLIERKKPEQSGVSLYDFADFIYENQAQICLYIPEAKNLSDLVYIIDKSVDANSYDQPSMPDLDTYNNMVNSAISHYKCDDPDVINESKAIMNRFYAMKSFTVLPGELILTELRLTFDKQWKPLNDFFSKEAFFRGIIDLISYQGDYVVITDYKSSRKMLTLKEFKEDFQTIVYVLLVCKLLPKGSFKSIIVRTEYIRYAQSVEYEITNPEEVADRATKWINNIIQDIETEMLKTDGSSFQPKRNEYCHTCHLGEDGACPLFNKHISGKLDDPFSCSVSSMEECRAAWKRIETNDSENSRLTKMCKSFTKQCEDPIIIDKNAKLDFWMTKYREYDTKKTVLMLLGKEIDMSEFINYFSVSQESLNTLLEEKGITLTDEEKNSISREKTKLSFGAYTDDEAKGKGFVNS